MEQEIPSELIENAISNPDNEVERDLSDKTVVYFDQKAWGTIWDERSNSNKSNSLFRLAKRSVDEYDYVYPFSIENLIETTTASDAEFRSEIFDAMMDLSGNRSIRNYLDVLDHEVKSHLCKRHPLLRELNTRSFVFGEGLVHVAGNWKLEPEEKVPEEVVEEFERVTRDEKVNRELLRTRALNEDAPGISDEDRKAYEEGYRENVQEAEQDLELEDEVGRSEYLADVFVERLMPSLRQYSHDLGLDPLSVLTSDPNKQSFEAFFGQFPAFYTYGTLCFAVDAHTDRDPDFNDVFDISQLAVAAPYADIVVTERFFGGMLYRFDIGKVFDTTIFQSVGDFRAFLESALN